MASRKPCQSCKKMFGKCYVAFEFDAKRNCKNCAEKKKSPQNTNQPDTKKTIVNEEKLTHN